MKTIIQLLALFIVSLFFGCETEITDNDVTNNISETQSVNKGGNFIRKELVILYPDGTTEIEKQQKRTEYNIIDYKRCDCADKNLELWIFDGSPSDDINIEEKKETAKADEDLEGADLNPIIQIPEEQFITTPSIGILDNALNKVVKNNNNITIGVLDTGINYNYPGFSNSFLYNSGADGCSSNGYNDVFGWNFVDNNNNPFDNHPNQHGTIVSNIITSNLDANNISYQLLPVKIANQDGKINYFDAVCGFQYAIKKKNIKIINLSFGWTNNLHSLLNELIEKVENNILVVCSAGNNQENNDAVPHYPSSGEAENIFAITGLAGHATGSGPIPSGTLNNTPSNLGGLAHFSNHGTTSVDIAAVSENIPFQYNNTTHYVNGTSFSAAYATFFSAYYNELDLSAVALKNKVISNSNYSSELWKIKHSSYILLD